MRCYASPSQWSESEIRLSPDETHHLAHVLRRKVGDRVEVFDGAGRTAGAMVQTVAGKEARLVIQTRAAAAPPRVTLHLFPCLIREQKMDFIIQKATELGISSIVPLESRHAVVRLSGSDRADRQVRWQKIALNAAKQCGTAFLPAVDPVRTLAEFLAGPPAGDLRLFCSLEAEARPLRDVLAAARSGGVRSVGVLVGPEGDLDEAEKQAVRQAGFVAAGLGDLVLRAETAALYVLSVLNYEFRGRADPA